MTPTLTDPRIKTALIIGAITLVCTSSLAIMQALTHDRIALNEILATTERLNDIIPSSSYDNAIHDDTIMIRHDALSPSKPAKVWRARRSGEPVAAVMTVTAPDGYNGDIVSLVGVDINGTILGVRVLSHRETPGLGDDIELPRSDWIRSFDQLSLDNLPADQWQVRRDGGQFDQFTGATLTPRAVIRSVYRALTFFKNNRVMIFCQTDCESLMKSADAQIIGDITDHTRNTKKDTAQYTTTDIALNTTVNKIQQ